MGGHSLFSREGEAVPRNRTRTAPVFVLAFACVAFAAAGCTSFGSTTRVSDAKPAAASGTPTPGGTASEDGADPGCTKALQDVSHYGPSTVKLLADGRKAVTRDAVGLLVDGLDGAADAAGTPQAKQAIKTLADAYNDYFGLTTDAVSVPLSTLLKDTADLEFVCR
jgi:hypothetical protein